MQETALLSVEDKNIDSGIDTYREENWNIESV